MPKPHPDRLPVSGYTTPIPTTAAAEAHAGWAAHVAAGRIGRGSAMTDRQRANLAASEAALGLARTGGVW